MVDESTMMDDPAAWADIKVASLVLSTFVETLRGMAKDTRLSGPEVAQMAQYFVGQEARVIKAALDRINPERNHWEHKND